MNTTQYVLAGKATFTLSAPTERFTYRVKRHRSRGKTMWFVALLRGGDNEKDYQFLGTIFEKGCDLLGIEYPYYHGRKSRISRKAPSSQLFSEWWECPDCRDDVILHQSTHCARCGRLLTDPESIEMGIGPVCLAMLN